MAGDRTVPWERCSHDGCVGVQLAAAAWCLAHVAEQDPSALDAELERIGDEGTIDARGVQLSAELLKRILRAAPQENDHPIFKGEAQFDGATFERDAQFDRATFERTVGFGGATFKGDTGFFEATFKGAAGFGEATFKGDTRFFEATFKGDTWFGEATFEGTAGFDEATFEGTAGFYGATFRDHAGFREATFKGDARFYDATFKGDAGFDEATFERDAQFDGATFKGDARFGGATFKGDTGFRGATFKGDARFHEATFEAAVGFNGATFEAAVGFRRATFKGHAGFFEATFKGDARFYGATFEGTVGFDRATFERNAGFDEATFKGAAGFGAATFKGTVGFGGATFKGDAGFRGATFESTAGFPEATFERIVGFDGATFEGAAGFHRATFKRDAGFDRAAFKDSAGFDGATFEQAREIGPLLAKQLVLDEAVFHERVQLDVAAAALSAQRAQFPAGVQFRLRWASVVLDDANLAAPAILAGVAEPFPELGDDEQNTLRGWALPPGPLAQQGRPQLVSLCRADVAGLRVANVDLRPCRFVGAHNLDRLRIEGEPLFARAPGWWRTRRKTLAEEQHWRAGRSGRWRPRGWYPQACQPPAIPGVQPPPMLAPVQVAALYRELRKGREDAKDEPGAADFYYGEMEMRRRAQHEQAQHERRRGHWDTWAAARAEHAVVWLYWLLSGYALRAWRALAALTVVVLAAAVAFAFWGFPASAPSFRPVGVGRSGALVYQQRPAEPPPGVGRLPAAVRFSARSATALLRGPDRALTPLGEWLEIGLRFLGPVLLGLAVLSVRGRVRR
jgi:hypothetical protein